jgi:hypothetical protein
MMQYDCWTPQDCCKIDAGSMQDRGSIEVASIFSGFSMHSSTPRTKENIRHDAKQNIVERHNACSVA